MGTVPGRNPLGIGAFSAVSPGTSVLTVCTTSLDTLLKAFVMEACDNQPDMRLRQLIHKSLKPTKSCGAAEDVNVKAASRPT